MRPYPGGIRHDYKDSASAPGAFDARGLSWFALGLLLPLVGVLLLLFSETNESMVPPEAVPPAPERVAVAILPSSGERVELELPALTPPPIPDTLLPPDAANELSSLFAHGEALTLVVRSGDSLDRLFRRNNLSVADLAMMIAMPEAKPHLAKINPGNRIDIIRDGEHVLSLSREISEAQRFWIRRDGEGYLVELIDLEIETRTAGAHGIIESSLWGAASAAGLDSNVIEGLAGIFEWDIDFALEVRTGDSFTVIYEERWRDGEKLRNGDIIAAEFVNQGKSYRAARYVDATGKVSHFTPEGMNVRRAFLRNPIEFTRVSSNFNPNRRHPILNTIRAHRGVDLAAPTGTEVRAVGDGKIIALGANGSYGNRVEIQHGGNITTLYAHLSKFGRFRVGDRVTQRDIIGYVGMTGGATGPHLHYEYRIAGVHQNPRTVDLPVSEPIPNEFRNDFLASAESLWHQLDLYEGTRLAQNVE